MEFGAKRIWGRLSHLRGGPPREARRCRGRQKDRESRPCRSLGQGFANLPHCQYGMADVPIRWVLHAAEVVWRTPELPQ
jgi:hypothetical protein